MIRYWLGCFFILSSSISAIGVQLPYYRVRATWSAPTSSPIVKDVHTKLLNANGRVISISQTTLGISDIISLGPVPYPRIHRYSRFEKTLSQHEIISSAAGVAESPNHDSLTSSEFPETQSLRTLKPLTEPLHNQSVIPPPADSPMPLGDTVPPSGLSPPPSHTSDCCKANAIPRHGGSQCDCVYPIKLELLLLNVSFTSNPNWSAQVEQQLAFQLGLQVSQINIVNFYVVGVTGLNITMDLAPLKGTGFSKVDAHRINYTIVMHKVHIDPSLAGEYKLLNLTWFVPPAISPESAAPAPANAPAATPSSVATETKSNNSRRQSLTLIIGIGAGVVIVIILSISIIISCLFKQGKKQPPLKETVKPRNVDAVSAENSFPRPTSTRCFAFEELKEATNNFESASVLGEGGFGRVFKGVLSDGTAVAIKKLTSGGHQGDKEFLVEIEMLSRLHHRNLVKLIGYYSNRETSQHLLCYELVPNGSLESWLHGPNGASSPLSWESRMKIALDAARGLAYLHEDSQPCVIHRDFKASNILLENNFHAKVSDFGLAKQAPEGGRNHLSTRVMGTFGYVAPEYAMTGHLLVKSDVYSYGVVLLELLTGKRPVEMSQPSGQENLVTWARPILRDNNRLEELADSKLGGNYPKEDFVRVCTIAAACVAPEANQRPTMGEVVQSLKMVQRITEYQDTTTKSTCISRPNVRQSSTTYESDGTSSMFSSGPFSGISMIDNENTLRTAVFSEDLQEGR